MSYEGFSQVLCANGHLRHFDSWDMTGPLSEMKKCSCGAPYVFEHMVDETNGIIEDDSSTQLYPFEVNTPREFLVCDMGHEHTVKEVTYKIPVKK